MKTWANLLAFIAFECKTEGRSVDGLAEEADYLLYANEFIALLSAKALPQEHTYVSGVSELVLTNDVVALPTSMIAPPIGVYWGGQPLTLTTQAELDARDARWRSVVAGTTPSQYFINGRSMHFNPPVSAIEDEGGTLLEIIAYTQLTPFPATGIGEVNPMSVVPDEFQLLPAYYVLMNYPHDPAKIAEQTRFEINAARVQDMLPACIEAIKNLGRSPGAVKINA